MKMEARRAVVDVDAAVVDVADGWRCFDLCPSTTAAIFGLQACTVDVGSVVWTSG